MPELPEVETVRRALEATVLGRAIRTVRTSGLRLRAAMPPDLGRRLKGRTIERVDRHGKYLMIQLSDGLTLLSHLGMSGRWLFYQEPPRDRLSHVHVRIAFADGSRLHFQDPRRFGLLKLLPSEGVMRDPALAILGPDPIATPPTGEGLATLARGMKVSVKNFLIDQRRIAGVGNIYASEVLHRAGVNPRRRAGALSRADWEGIAEHTPRILNEAIERMGTTFSMYRTLWNEPGTYGERLMVYDRARLPCKRCGTPIRRIVQGQRSTFFCPVCQPAGGRARTRMSRATPSPRPRPMEARRVGTTRRPMRRKETVPA